MAKFSERVGAVEPKPHNLINGIDNDIRTKIWNNLFLYYFQVYEGDSRKTESRDNFKRHNQIKYIIEQIWLNELKRPWDEYCETRYEHVRDLFRKMVFDGVWYEPYELVEAFIKYENDKLMKVLFANLINKDLEKELSGYRFVDGLLIDITNQTEIEEVEGATKNLENLKGAKDHIHKAIIRLNDKKSPDYRNSIKESISAVESLIRVLTEKTKFSDAMDEISTKIGLEKAQKEGFKKMYGYTSGENGIRHALMDKDNVQREDAKYMLVSCSAFINYLIEKARKAGIELK